MCQTWHTLYHFIPAGNLWYAYCDFHLKDEQTTLWRWRDLSKLTHSVSNVSTSPGMTWLFPTWISLNRLRATFFWLGSFKEDTVKEGGVSLSPWRIRKWWESKFQSEGRKKLRPGDRNFQTVCYMLQWCRLAENSFWEINKSSHLLLYWLPSIRVA